MKPRHDIVCRLRHFRRENGALTQQELADRVGVTRQTILSIEKGRYSPTIGLALKLAKVLMVTVEDLFTLTSGDHDV